MTMQEYIAKRIRELTIEQGLPLSHLAEMCGLSKNTIYNVANANTDASLYSLIRISEGLGVGLSEVFPGETKTRVPENEEERAALEWYRSLEPLKKARADGYLYAIMESKQVKISETDSER